MRDRENLTVFNKEHADRHQERDNGEKTRQKLVGGHNHHNSPLSNKGIFVRFAGNVIFPFNRFLIQVVLFFFLINLNS